MISMRRKLTTLIQTALQQRSQISSVTIPSPISLIRCIILINFVSISKLRPRFFTNILFADAAKFLEHSSMIIIVVDYRNDSRIMATKLGYEESANFLQNPTQNVRVIIRVIDTSLRHGNRFKHPSMFHCNLFVCLEPD